MTTTVRDVLAKCKSHPENLNIYSSPNVSESRKKEYLAAGYAHYQGKVRDLFIKDEQVEIFHSDRLTAFDRAICNVPQRGIILAALTEYWMREAGDIIPVQKFTRRHPRWVSVEKAEPIKIELVVRGYLAGSMLRAYLADERIFCGHPLPDGLSAYEKLPRPIITPTTKAAVFEHDENISVDAILEQHLCTEAEWQKISQRALQLFSHGQLVYAKAGWVLADTKYEFGRRHDGEIILIDECHTPDSSRLWQGFSNRQPKMFDKEIVRSYLSSKGFIGEGIVPEVPSDIILNLAESYLDVAESVCGEIVSDIVI